MKLWKLEQDVNIGHDIYDSAIVSAETENEARIMYPGRVTGDYPDGVSDCNDWALPADVVVTCLGEAEPGLGKCVLCASFNE